MPVFIALLLAAVPSWVWGQGLQPGNAPALGAVPPQPAIYAPFRTAGCLPPGGSAGRNAPLTVTRATAQTHLEGGAVVSCGNNTASIGPTGFESYVAGTQLYPTPTAPAAGSVTTTATGAHIFWVSGAGSQALSVNSATATGLPCTATQASPCSFTITVAGTLTLAAVTGSLDRAQIEKSPYATPFIPALGTRNATTATTPLPAGMHIANRWCVSAKASPAGGSWVRAVAGPRIWSTYGGTLPNNAILYVETGGALSFGVYDSAGAVRYIRTGAAVNGAHRVVGCNDAGKISMYVDGVSMGAPTVVGTGLWNATPAVVGIGVDTNGVTQFDGAISELRLYYGTGTYRSWMDRPVPTPVL